MGVKQCSLIDLQSGVVRRNADSKPWLEVRSGPKCKPTTFSEP